MSFEKIEKILLFVLIICALSAVSIYMDRDVVKDELVFHSFDEPVEFIKVSVTGEVRKPGEYVIKKGSRVHDLIYAAGGVTGVADIESLDTDVRLLNKMNVVVPKVGDDKIPRAVPVININTADAETLCIIPGIGEVIAERIIEYRNENGLFTDISQIMNVNGIGEKTFAKIKDFIKTEETQK